MNLIELAAQPWLVERQVRLALGDGLPAYWREEIADEMVVRLVERQARNPNLKATRRTTRQIAIDAARTVTKGRRLTIGPDLAGMELASPPSQFDPVRLRERLEDEANEDHEREWRGLPPSVREFRAREAMKALGTLPPRTS